MIDYPTTITVGEGSDAYSSTTWYSESYTVCTTSGGDSGPIVSGGESIGGCKCESTKDVSIIDNEQILKDMRLQEIKDSVYLEIENPCLQAMVTKAVYENLDNQISRIISLVFESSETVNLSFYEATDLSSTTLGEAIVGPVTSGEMTRIQADIFLNVNVLPNSSQEIIVSTIFHEVLHAYLGYSRSSELFNDHEEMASEYVGLMCNS